MISCGQLRNCLMWRFSHLVGKGRCSYQQLILCSQLSSSSVSPDNPQASKHGTAGSWSKIQKVGAVVSSLIALLFVGVLYDARKKRRRKNIGFPTAVHRDPLIDRTGHLIQHEGTWLSEFLFPSRQRFEEIRDFRLGADDILVVSFPKSGTTWVQEIVSQIRIVTGEAGTQTDVNMEDRFPYLEYVYPGVKEIQRQPSPRLIKSHLPYHLLPLDVQDGRGKVIYIARNAKDVCVSYYHFIRMLSFLHYKGNFNQFFEAFISGRVSSGPWVDHVSRFWQHRDDDNVLFVTYEELHKRPAEVIRRVGDFLGYSLTEDQLGVIVHATSFESMKRNSLTNYSWWNELGLLNKNTDEKSRFMRKGSVGDWRNHLTAEMNDIVEQTCLEPLRNLNLTFIDTRSNDTNSR